MNAIAPIYVGQLQDGVVWIRVEGKGSFQNSPELKDFAVCMIKRGATKFVIDLENCPVMDSTFMGTLVGIVRKQNTSGESSFEILNANARNVQLIQNLGLDQLLTLDLDGNAWPEIRHRVSGIISNGDQLEHVELAKQKNNEHILEAHQQLSEADGNNVPRFYDVIEFLKKELQSSPSS
ncbi:MAG: STAS domain-containing protein [Verrucomicrobiales bacterium]